MRHSDGLFHWGGGGGGRSFLKREKGGARFPGGGGGRRHSLQDSTSKDLVKKSNNILKLSNKVYSHWHLDTVLNHITKLKYDIHTHEFQQEVLQF